MQWLHLNHPEESDRDLNDYCLDVPPAKPLKLDTAIILSLSSPCAYNADHKKQISLIVMFLVVPLMSHLQLVSPQDLFPLFLMQINMFQYLSGLH